MATGKEWEDHFRTLTKEARQELKDALLTLGSDTLFRKEFSDTGLFSLQYYIDMAQFRSQPIQAETPH